MSRKISAWTLIVVGLFAALAGFVFSLGGALTLTGVVAGAVLFILGLAAYPSAPARSSRRSGDGYVDGGGDTDDNDGDGGDGDGGSDGGGGDGGGGGGGGE